MSDAEMQINLSVLKKHDAEIDRIIDTASSVAHYKFKASSGVWDKTEVEGSLFLYSRSVPPYVVIFIMNRLNKQNTKLSLTPDMDFKVQKPFLLCKAANNEIIGIWFYSEAECERFGALLTKLALLAKDEKSLRIAAFGDMDSNYQNFSPQRNGLLDMFSKAKEEYKKTRPKPACDKTNKNNRSKVAKQPPTILKRNSESNLSSFRKSSPSCQDLHSQSKQQQGNEEKRTQQCSMYNGQTQDLVNSFHSHVMTSSDVTRSRALSSLTERNVGESKKLDYSSREAGDLAVLDRLGLIQEHVLPSQGGKIIDCAALESAQLNYNGEVNCKTSSAELTSNNATRTHKQLLSPSLIAGKSGKGRGATLSALLNGPQKVSIAATPSQASTSSRKLFCEDSKDSDRSSPPEPPPAAALSSLMAPAAFQASKQPATANKPKKETLLSRDQFQLALLHCIQNDDNFVNTLHEAYLEVAGKTK